ACRRLDMRRPRRTQFRSSEAGGHRNRPWGNASSVREAQDDETIAVCSSPFVDGPRSLGLRFVSIPTPLDDFGLLIGCQQPSSELVRYALEPGRLRLVGRRIGEFELSNEVDGHEGFSNLGFWMSSGRCRWALISPAFGTLTSIKNFAAVTASKAGKEGTVKKI